MAELPIESIEPSPAILGILKKWGIHTLGSLLALGKEPLAERLGPEAVELFERASANCTRPLRLAQPAEVFEEQIEFENAIETVQPLLLSLRRFLEQISLRLKLACLVAEELTLRLHSDASGWPTSCSPSPLGRGSHAARASGQTRASWPVPDQDAILPPPKGEGRGEGDGPRVSVVCHLANNKSMGKEALRSDCYEHVFKIPAPTREIEPLLRMLQTHLETLKAEHPIVGLALSVKPCRPANQQFELFEAALRDPNRFYETVGRLAALVGSDRVGTPILEPTHRPDAFHMQIPAAEFPSAPNAETPAQDSEPCGLCLRRFRPPLPMRLESHPGGTMVLSSSKSRERIVQMSGPWLGSGDWWDKHPWSRIEWDVQTETGNLYRLFQQEDLWFVEGTYG